MTHDYHQGLPGFSPEQILHDGCGECEERASSPARGIAELDTRNFARAWDRATKWHQRGMPDISNAEAPMLRVLWAIQVQLERYGQPIGTLPVRVTP